MPARRPPKGGGAEVKFGESGLVSRVVRGTAGDVQGVKNKKILIAAIAVAIFAGLGAAVAMVLTRGGGLRYQTQAELLKGLPADAKAELTARGKQLAQPLTCQNMPEADLSRLLVRCTGTTTDRQQVQVFGSALPESKAEYYTILVAGEPLVKNVGCLGADCKGD